MRSKIILKLMFTSCILIVLKSPRMFRRRIVLIRKVKEIFMSKGWRWSNRF